MTESLVKVVNEKQDEIVKCNSVQLDSLHVQPTLLSRQLTLSATDVSKPPNQYPQPLQRQCDVCGQTFGLNRALVNKVWHDHKPNASFKNQLQWINVMYFVNIHHYIGIS